MQISTVPSNLRHHALKPLAPKLPSFDSPPPRGDVFEKSTPKEPAPLLALVPPVKEKKRLAKALGFALALSAGLVATTMPSVAVAAQVESVQKSAVSKTLSNAQARKLLAKLPKSLARTASGLSDGQVKVLKGGLHGETKFGPITVNHRKAFIKGSAWGKSVWPEINGQIRDARSKHGMITRAEERELLQLVSQVSKLSKSDRAIMADLMDMVRLR